MSNYQTISFNSYEITPYVKKLIIITVAVWFFGVVILQQHFLKPPFLLFQIFGLSPSAIFSDYYVWQFGTYMFLHANGIFHILFNMFILWMFGSELEKLWGSRFFLIYYLACGIGAGLIYMACFLTYTFTAGVTDFSLLGKPIIGASGAIFGLLYAYGVIYRERTIYLMMVFPIKAINFVFLVAAIELVSLLNNGFNSPIANLAHLGGIAAGASFLFFRKYFHRISVRRWKKQKGSIHLKILKNNDKEEFDFH